MNDKYMKIAMDEANKSLLKDEVPVGCVIVKNNKIIAKSHNLKEKKQSVLQHAELIAITKASKRIKNWRLNGCEMYVTLEPCLMCYNTILSARIDKVYYCVPRTEECKCEKNSKIIKYDDESFEKEGKNMLQTFFKTKRN